MCWLKIIPQHVCVHDIAKGGKWISSWLKWLFVWQMMIQISNVHCINREKPNCVQEMPEYIWIQNLNVNIEWYTAYIDFEFKLSLSFGWKLWWILNTQANCNIFRYYQETNIPYFVEWIISLFCSILENRNLLLSFNVPKYYSNEFIGN